ncbi:long-chain fatty acid--CoA ligase [Gordonia paraffinivorans]|uniref:long-chain fatty acid--CoA ligase n=1 Tax=Gordonia paraffinivorans TaxID=175628 RepID=UPI001C93154A|nr:long-chain fatty acid--CoA ligase [Gordonia paraffinivorans]MBY4576082.1 long-chain fatty acid--CoA ligase [Gordonia paraffinivorans]
MLGQMQDRPLALPMLINRIENQYRAKTVTTEQIGHTVSTTYGELATRIRALAGVLDDLKVPREARVGTFGWNTQRHLELYLAVPCTERILHTINHRLFAEQLTFIVNDAADDVLFVDRSILETIWPVVDTFTTVRHIIVMDDGADFPLPDDPRILDYETLLSAATPHRGPFHVAEERTAAALCYTSGTTGQPKGVLYDHRSIVLHALTLQLADSFALSESDTIMPVVPMFHVNAWGLPYAALMCGADLVMPGTATRPEQLLDQIERHQVTFTAAVTTVWRNAAPFLDGRDLSSLRHIVCGGGAVPVSLSRLYHERIGQPLRNAWGMTETSPVVTSARISTAEATDDTEQQLVLLAGPGPALPLTELRLMLDDGTLAPHDGHTRGELQVAGPTIAGGYFGLTHRSDAITEDGWLRTGDVATIDEHGQLRIVDRTKDLIKSGGEWISSVELENEIMAHPGVVEAAVIAVPDDRWGERPMACVVPVTEGGLSSEDVREFLRDRVASWWIPEQIRVIEEIPKTATGKFSKVTLREKMLQQQN